MDQKFQGIFPALLTPFDENQQVDFAALEKMVSYEIGTGIQGFYVGGSTAEAFLLTDDERKDIMKCVKDVAGNQVTLIAHIGNIGTAKTVALAQCAEKLGYDAVSSVSPFYYKFSFEEIKQYYYDIADSVCLPVLLYNIPLFSGVSLTVDQVSQFLCDDRFIGVKHTSNDYFALRQFKNAFPDKVIYNGYDEMFLCGLSMGADGAIGSTFNFMADKFIKVRKLFMENNVAEAAKVQAEISDIIARLLKYGLMPATKAIMDALGVPCGLVRAPFKQISEENKKKMLDEIMPLL